MHRPLWRNMRHACAAISDLCHRSYDRRRADFRIDRHPAGRVAATSHSQHGWNPILRGALAVHITVPAAVFWHTDIYGDTIYASMGGLGCVRLPKPAHLWVLVDLPALCDIFILDYGPGS